MARKPSVILSVQERKAAQSGIKSEIDAAKDQLKELKAQEKDLKTREKELAKSKAITEKLLSGLNVRHDALKPAKKAAPINA